MSLIEAFAAVGRAPTHNEIGRFIRENFLSTQALNSPNTRRRAKAAQRLRLYEDDYDQDIDALINLIFESEQARKQRRRLRELAKAQNALRRVGDELASTYDKPARRLFPDARSQALYDQIEKALDLHETMKQASRLDQVLNEVLIWWRWSEVDGQPTLTVVTPDAFDIVPDPRDRLREGAIIVDSAPIALDAREATRLEHYQMWDDTYRYSFDADGTMLGHAVEHGYGRIPGYVVHRTKPRTALFDTKSRGDLVSGQLVVVFLNLLIVRLAKAQGENQPTLSGDLARIATGMSFDGESPIPLPPGVVAQMLQSKTDPEHYLKAKRDYITGMAATYGMSYEQFTFSEKASEASGKAYTVRREKLSELRDEQVLRDEKHEIEVARLISDMLAVAGIASVDPDVMRVDFHDPRMPQDPGEELDVLDKGIRLGVDNVIRFSMRKYGFDRKEAQEYVTWCVAVRAQMAQAMRALNIPGDPTQAGQDPAVNGAQGPRQVGDGSEEDEDAA